MFAGDHPALIPNRTLILILDILSVMPILFSVSDAFGILPDYSKYFLFCSFFLLVRLSEKTLKSESQGFHSLSKRKIYFFALVSVMSAHWIAVFWLLIGGSAGETDKITIYIKGLYWTVTTLTTIGYGDIVPQTNPQRIFTMIVMIIGAGLYGYIIGNITNLLSKVDYAKAVFTEKMEKIHIFLNYRKVPEDLKAKIFGYYDFIWQNRRGYDETSIMEELPEALRLKVAMFLNKKVFEKISIFAGASEDFIEDIVMVLKPAVFTPGDYIFKKGEVGSSMYFIAQGRVEVLNDLSREVIAVISEGGFFGEFALLESRPRSATVRAVDFCDLYSLDRDSFYRVLQNYPEFHEKIKKIYKDRDGKMKKFGTVKGKPKSKS